jgi:mono/diheme cytochrome c family protein
VSDKKNLQGTKLGLPNGWRGSSFLVISLIVFASLLCARKTSANTDDVQVLATRALNILKTRCFSCHGAEKQEGEIRLDSIESLISGDGNGPLVVPRDAESSKLIQVIATTDEEKRMPPKSPLSPDELETLRKWVASGAVGVKHGSIMEDRSDQSIGSALADERNPIRKLFGGQRLDLWSLQPITRPSVPTVQNQEWPLNAIDCFVLHHWERNFGASFRPAGDASLYALARRTSFDLIGLPPSYSEMSQLLASTHSNAYEVWVDRLLSSPNYGPRWARMWLDVVRYSDSNGFDWDEFRPTAWRYRDYVVSAWNEDLPFDQFTIEQLAGDELLAGAPQCESDQSKLIATGYLRSGPHDNSAPSFNEQDRSRAELMADLTETTGSAFLGLTLSCCRCHDHKTEPLSQADHYRFRAFFSAVRFADDVPLDLPDARQMIEHHNGEIENQIADLERQIQEQFQIVREQLTKNVTRTGVSDAGQSPAATNLQAEVTDKQVRESLSESQRATVDKLVAKKMELESQKKKYTVGMLMTDKNEDIPTTHVLYQGDHKAPRQAIAPGFPSVIDPNHAGNSDIANKQSTGRRTTLAKWIVSERNPWTARVIVNRLWQAHFGRGLVATANDFGFSGEPPSHPDLLDWLASELMDAGWSIKHLQYLIVTSRTYRQSVSKTPGNRKEHLTVSMRTQLHRLDAESLRDAMLQVSGQMNLQIGGPPAWPDLPSEVLQANPAFLDDNEQKTKGWYPSPLDQQMVRSLFLVQKRGVRVPFMETFDLPDNSVSCARREVSLVAPQALSLLNGPWMENAAAAMSEEIRRQVGEETSQQIEAAYRLVFQRNPNLTERRIIDTFLIDHTLVELCRSLMNTNEFVFVE